MAATMLLVGVTSSFLVIVGWWFGFLWPMIYITVGLVSAFYTAQWNLLRGKFYRPPPPKPQVNLASVLLQKMMVKMLFFLRYLFSIFDQKLFGLQWQISITSGTGQLSCNT